MRARTRISQGLKQHVLQAFCVARLVTRLGGGAVVRRSGPYLELRIRVCRAAWGIDAIGVDKHRPRSESEKSTWKSTTFFTYHNDGSRRTPACNIAIESGSPAAPQATGPPVHRPVSACRATRALPTEPLTREGCTWSPCCFVGACEKHTHVPH